MLWPLVLILFLLGPSPISPSQTPTVWITILHFGTCFLLDCQKLFKQEHVTLLYFLTQSQCMLGVLQFRVSSLIIYLKILKCWSCGNSPQSHRVLICCIAILGCIVGLSHKEWRRICYQSLCRIEICIVGASMQFERCHRICFKLAKHFSISLSLLSNTAILFLKEHWKLLSIWE